MIRAFTLFLALVTTSPLLAQTISVTSGEHPGFSRLLLDGQGEIGWTVGRVDGGFEFRFDEKVAFDLRRALERIPRTRILALEDRNDGVLFISSDCECHIFAFSVGQGDIALDVRTGAAPEEAQSFNARLDAPTQSENELEEPEQPATTDTQPTVSNTQIYSVIDVTAFDLSSSETEETDAESHEAEDRQIALPITFDVQNQPGLVLTLPDVASAQINRSQPEETVPTSDRAQETEAALLGQIARAAAQGLVEADLPEPDPMYLPEQEVDQPERQPAPLPAISAESHVSIVTSIDNTGRDRRGDHTDGGRECYPDALFQVNDWGHPLDDGTNIGVFRAKIIGEFDEADGIGVTALARHYIYITFGAEAKSVVHRFSNDIERPDVLIMLADIMDNGQARSAVSVVGQMACDGPVALWAAAAQPKLYRYQTINSPAIQLAFANLPAHLRRHIGPELSSKFLAIDDKVTADAIYAATDRVFPEETPELGLLEAKRSLVEGDPATATQALDSVVEKADDILPEALIERVEAALVHGEPVPDDLISLVESVGFEHRGTDTGAALARAEIRALASAAHYAEAFRRLDGARRDGTAEGNVAVDLGREIFSLLVTDPSDEEFLLRTVPRLGEASVLETNLKREISTRLLELGFPDEARVVLGGSATLPAAEDRLVYARIAIAQSKPQVAIGYLAGLDSNVALQLRAEAMSLARDHAGAMETFDLLGDAASSVREAWRGGFWNELALRSDNAFGSAGDMMISLDQPREDLPAPILARNAALIEESQSSRAEIEALLTEVRTVTPDPSAQITE